jgi:hypothetical protein
MFFHGDAIDSKKGSAGRYASLDVEKGRQGRTQRRVSGDLSGHNLCMSDVSMLTAHEKKIRYTASTPTFGKWEIRSSGFVMVNQAQVIIPRLSGLHPTFYICLTCVNENLMWLLSCPRCQIRMASYILNLSNS